MSIPARDADRPPRVAVVGGGPGGLMAAERLARAGADVTVFDRMPTVGRKLLRAGRGGLNITHAEPLPAFLMRYGAATGRLGPAIEAFDPTALRAWCASLGQDTFVGSSGRVFPAAFRATPLLRAWLERLAGLGVDVRTRHRWLGWDGAGALRFADAEGTPLVVPADATVLALGGASWPRLGSDGGWVPTLEAIGVQVAPLRPANCGVLVEWTAAFADRFAGEQLKNVELGGGGASGRGDAIVTAAGLEGGAVYAVAAPLRDAIDASGHAVATVDLRPDVGLDAIATRLAAGRARDSTASRLRRAGLRPVEVGLLREATGNQLALGPAALARLVKAVPLRLVGVAPVDRAISTAGGVVLDEVDGSFMLRRRPGTFVVGEMLDWEAPTGGYLLQATFSTAVAAADGVLAWLGRR